MESLSSHHREHWVSSEIPRFFKGTRLWIQAMVLGVFLGGCSTHQGISYQPDSLRQEDVDLRLVRFPVLNEAMRQISERSLFPPKMVEEFSSPQILDKPWSLEQKMEILATLRLKIALVLRLFHAGDERITMDPQTEIHLELELRFIDEQLELLELLRLHDTDDTEEV